jgi:hypothetical protein
MYYYLLGWRRMHNVERGASASAFAIEFNWIASRRSCGIVFKGVGCG